MFRIPVFSEKFDLHVENMVKEGFLHYNESKEAMREAEQLLMETLELRNFSPQTERYSVKSFKSTIGDRGRLDAEFYQSFYDEFEKKVKSNGFVTYCILGNKVNWQRNFITR